jgi:hypothetical protein
MDLSIVAFESKEIHLSKTSTSSSHQTQAIYSPTLKILDQQVKFWRLPSIDAKQYQGLDLNMVRAVIIYYWSWFLVLL